PPPPTSTLFPYTTLFRSHVEVYPRLGRDGARVFYGCRTVLVFSKSIKPIPTAALWKLPLAAPGSPLHRSRIRAHRQQSQLLSKKVSLQTNSSPRWVRSDGRGGSGQARRWSAKV